MTHVNVHLAPILDDAFEGDCVADRSRRLSYPEFRTAVHTTAAALEKLGVRRGDIVATVLSNRVELVVTMFAAWTLGAGLTPVNPALTDDEVAYQLTDAGVSLVVAEPATAGKLGTGAALDADGLLDRSPVTARSWAQPEGHELALVVYTSGTTGRPKGVMLDHANVAAMTRMTRARSFVLWIAHCWCCPCFTSTPSWSASSRPSHWAVHRHRGAVRRELVLDHGCPRASDVLLRRSGDLLLPDDPARRDHAGRVVASPRSVRRRADAG